MKYNYGYNGSGLPLHCQVTPLLIGRTVAGKVKVRFSDDFIPPFDRYSEDHAEVDNERWVNQANLYGEGESAPIASFNWND